MNSEGPLITLGSATNLPCAVNPISRISVAQRKWGTKMNLLAWDMGSDYILQCNMLKYPIEIEFPSEHSPRSCGLSRDHKSQFPAIKYIGMVDWGWVV